MKPLYTILALATAAFLTACASQTTPGAGPLSAAKADEHAAHQAAAASPTAPPAMHERMKNMQAMRDKMMNARTPAERQALMAEHMKAMHDGMDTMKGMKGMGGMSGMKHMPMEPGKQQQMLEMRMDMMQTMMEMMMQRMPGSTLPPTSQ